MFDVVSLAVRQTGAGASLGQRTGVGVIAWAGVVEGWAEGAGGEMFGRSGGDKTGHFSRCSENLTAPSAFVPQC